jgi:hypothetical protein
MSGKNAYYKFNVCSFTLHSSSGGEGRCVERLMGKFEGKIPLGRPRCRWKYNIKMNRQEIGWGYGLDSSGSGQGQVADICKRGKEPSGSIKCG